MVDNGQQPIRLLIVEDDENDYFLTSQLLEEIERMDFETEWVSTYDAAVAAFEDEQYDICLLDYQLGEQNGLGLLRETAQRGFALPVILFTSQDDCEIDIEALRAGASDYLVKGQLAPHQLERAIRYTLDRARNLRALSTTKERYDLALSGTRDGLWDWNLRSGQIYFSESWLTMLGHAPDDRYETRGFWYARIHAGDLERFESELQSHLYGLTQVFQCEYRIRHKDGTFRWVLARGIAVRDSIGKAHRIVGSQLDVTQRRAAVERLLANVSHELRTPLNAIYQFVTIMLDGLAGDVSDEQRDFLEIAHRNTVQLKQLIGDLVEVAQANTGKLHVEPRPFDLSASIVKFVNEHAAAASARGIRLDLIQPAGRMNVFADRNRVRQVIDKLVENAINFSDDDGTISISLFRSELEDDMVCIEVADSGCGIPNHRAQRIFDRLYGGDDEQQDTRQGLGLGLYIARELVTRQGGRIWVVSEEDKGSTFTFTLPAFSDEA